MKIYQVYVESSAERSLKRLPRDVLVNILSHIKALAQEPRPAGCRKLAGTSGDWRIRVGEYRIIYEIDDKEKTVRVMKIRHRSTAYRLYF